MASITNNMGQRPRLLLLLLLPGLLWLLLAVHTAGVRCLNGDEGPEPGQRVQDEERNRVGAAFPAGERPEHHAQSVGLRAQAAVLRAERFSRGTCWWWTTWRTPSCPSSSWVSVRVPAGSARLVSRRPGTLQPPHFP